MAAPSSSLVGPSISTSGLHASLHPLVLLTISDYITRHTLQGSTQPLVGALLGQSKGIEITIEHAYDVKIQSASASGEWALDAEFFADRLEQYKDVHKQPPLDLVGWWTTASTATPGSELLGIHKYVLQAFSESSLVLVFQPEATGQAALEQARDHAGTKLPLTILETVYEAPRGDADGDTLMADEGQGRGEEDVDFKFAELPYEMVTGEAEMIAMDFVAKGSGNATAVETKEDDNGKGKAKETMEKQSNPLSAQDEELISFLNSRANAIKMLQSRISQLRSYLHRLPSSYLTNPSIPIDSSEALSSQSHQILRSISALTSRLPHLLPADTEAFLQEKSAEQADVAIVTLLGNLGQSAIDAKELGRSFSVAEGAKNVGRKTGKGPPGIGDHFLGPGDQDWSRLEEG